MLRYLHRTLVGVLLAVFITIGGGCSVAPSIGNVAPTEIAPDTVVVAFRNLSATDAVFVNFHAAGDPSADLPADLFVEANLITRDIGLAGTGIIQPQQFDALFDFPCSPDLVLGTSGGVFVDGESGDERGTGPARWAQASALGFCGGVVTFTFDSEVDEFATQLSIVHSQSAALQP